VLWRLLAELGVEQHGEEARQLFLDAAPIGFFAGGRMARVVYMNRALRDVLALR